MTDGTRAEDGGGKPGESRWQRLRRRSVRIFALCVAGGDEHLAGAVARSFMWHVLVVGIWFLPLLLQWLGYVEPYRLPPGGRVEAQRPQVKRVNLKKQPRVIHNPHADIAFNFPEVLDVDLKLDKLTENAFGTAKLGVGSGKGKGAGYGGGAGMGGKIRFIRLKYDGGDWDRNYGMNADNNMLRQFGQRTGIAVADQTEHVTVRDLRKFPKKLSPPFLYMTGEGGIVMNDDEVKTLREYVTERGGLIFADNSGGQFHNALLNLMKRVLPQYSVVEIPFDDEIFQQPYALPGAPPLWHHSGYRALGIRHQGRWVVFYHQGDIGDAWRDGHSGAPQSSWEAAYQMGVNVIDYAVRNYMKIAEAQ